MQLPSLSASQHHKLWQSVVLKLVLELAGVIPGYVRGITLNFDEKIIRLTVFFNQQPTEQDVEAMQNIEAELVSCHDYQSDLVLSVLPISENIRDKVENWGWVFLRKED